MPRERTRKNTPDTTDAEPLATGSGAPEGAPTRSIELAIGAEVRALRKQMERTVQELADASGLSIGMLSKIENGQISPSLATLQALAGALNVPISRLFNEFEERRDCSYVPAGTGVTIDRRGTKVGHQYQLLGASLSGELAVEPYLITLTEDAVPYTSFRHEGMEFIHMLDGAISYRHGANVYPLGPGDSLLFDSQAQHGPEAMTKLPARYLSIILYKR
ncbi:helix-turn-helix domain-containing protein [Parapedomonas caeni]